jgi:hypothetical protein
MRYKGYGIVSGVVFLAVAVAHLIRLFTHAEIQFGSHVVPMAASWAALIVAGLLSAWGFSTACCCGTSCETPAQP